MKKLDLTNFGVQELNEQELLAVEGGSIFSKAWNGIKAAGEWVAGQCVKFVCDLLAKEGINIPLM